jgi:integrase
MTLYLEGKTPLTRADVKDSAAEHLATIHGAKIPAERITTMGDFVANVYLPWVDAHARPSTAKGYRGYWEETYAYSLEEVNTILAHIPEPATTAFAVAAYVGLRSGEIEGLRWEDYRDGEIHVTRSRWNGHEEEPKTRKSRAPVPVIRQLAERLEMHRMRFGLPQTGPIFATSKGTPQNMNNLRRMILPMLKRSKNLPDWHGWHACRRGLGSNLYRLGVPDIVIQRILRHANVSTTTGYYIKTASDDVREAMVKYSDKLDTIRTSVEIEQQPM